MLVDQVSLVVFSPTGTTRRVANTVVSGFGCRTAAVLDCTKPEVRAAKPAAFHGSPVILAAPVHSGRLPAVAADAFAELSGGGAPAVLLTVYGNRAYEDALLELSDIAVTAGFVPAAAGAFIGEHSYSTPDFPLSAGRPGAADLRLAAEFGRQVKEKLTGVSTAADLPPLRLPGNHPYRERGGRSGLSPVTDTAVCRQCGTCTAACPVGAVKDGVNNDAPCLLCHACVRQCPAGARSFPQPRLKEIRQWLRREFTAPRQPELFI
ncbi:MAG: 4Fe-4S binding protein [bacterium]